MANEKTDFWNHFVRKKLIRKLFEEYKGDTDKLSEKELEIYHLNNFEEYIYCGGFLLLYENGSVFFQKITTILSKLNAFRCLDLLQQAYTLIQPYLQEEELPEAYLSVIPPDVYKALQKIDEALWQNPENLDMLCYKYYIENKQLWYE